MKERSSPVSNGNFFTVSGKPATPAASASIALPDVRPPPTSQSPPHSTKPIFPQLPKPRHYKSILSPRHNQVCDCMGVSKCHPEDDLTSRKPIRTVHCNLVNDLEEEYDSGVYATNDEALIDSTNPVTPSPHKSTSSSTAFFVVGGSSGSTRGLLVENELKGVERVKSSSHGFRRADSSNGINVAISPFSSNDG